MNKTYLKIIAIALIVCMVIWIGQNKKMDGGKDTIVIGAILPLTGDVAFVGEPIKNAIQLYLDNYNRENEKKVEVIFEDSRADKNKALSILQNFRTQKVNIILGPVTSGEVLSLAPEAEKNKIVILSPGASASSITNAGDFIFRNELSDDLGAKAQAQLAIEKLNWKRIAVLYTNNDYGVGVLKNFEARFTQLGGIVTSKVAFESESSDFHTQIATIKRYPSDALFIIAQNEYPNIIKQIKEYGIKTPIYATPIFEDASFIELLGRLSEGIFYTYYGNFDVQSIDNNCKTFVNDFKSKFNVYPSYYAALGFDNIGLMIEALKSVSFDQSRVKDGLYSISGYQGVTGEISFDNNGDVYKPVILKKVENGHFVIVK